MSKPVFSKPALRRDELARVLIRRGLSGISESELSQKLQYINYYRLRGYTYPYQDNSHEESLFIDGISWETIWSDYVFDSELRILLFDGISRFEIALRSIVTQLMSEYKGPYWYTDESLFLSETKFERDLRELKDAWNRSKDDFKNHFVENYNSASLPPAWMIFETSTLGLVSKYFENLNKSLEPRTMIMRQFGFNRSSGKVFLSWIRQLTYIRNICAHHARLFSRRLTCSCIIPTNLDVLRLNESPDANKVYVCICILKYLLSVCAPDYSFKEKLFYLLDNASESHLRFMGCPKSWKEQPLFMS